MLSLLKYCVITCICAGGSAHQNAPLLTTPGGLPTCVICTTPLHNQPVLSRLKCGHLFCPTCIGEWASYLAGKNITPNCPLCRGDASMQELVPKRVVLTGVWLHPYARIQIARTWNHTWTQYTHSTDEGTVRKSKERPGFLHHLPGRKALPFNTTLNTAKRKATVEQSSDALVEAAKTVTVCKIGSLQSRQLVEERCQHLQQEHRESIEQLEQQHADNINHLHKTKIIPLKAQVSSSLCGCWLNVPGWLVQHFPGF